MRILFSCVGAYGHDLTVFRTILDALEHVDCSVIVTIGPANDPGLLDPVPANARSADSVAGEIARMPHPDDVAPAIVASA
jgi:UDP:flavonoid glycosyltransferase YjiC (YdhE family)